MKINIAHTYTMTSFLMDIDNISYIVKEGYSPGDGETEVRSITELLTGNVIPPDTDEWHRLERIFQRNRTE